jgi:hypothetical protein
MAKNILYGLTRAIAYGITMLRVSIKSVLPNLFLNTTVEINESETPLIYNGDYPERPAHAYGEYLDKLGYMFDRPRNYKEEDENYRIRILSALVENSTLSGIKSTVSYLLQTEGIEADVQIRESYKDFFDGTSSTFDAPLRDSGGTLLYGISIVITPKSIMVPRLIQDQSGETVTKDFVTYYVDGEEVTSVYPNGVTWGHKKNLYLTGLLNAFRVSSLKLLLNDITASGVRVTRVVLLQAGAAGVRGQMYYYE